VSWISSSLPLRRNAIAPSKPGSTATMRRFDGVTEWSRLFVQGVYLSLPGSGYTTDRPQA
jgi:hypothetical protein